MKRLAVVEFVMSAGGVERVLRGLARAFLEIPESRSWDITFLLSRYNTAHHRVEWPAELTGERVRVEWLGEQNPVSRVLDPIAHGQGVLDWRVTRTPGLFAARAARSLGGPRWRAFLGDPFSLIARASERFDVMYFTYPIDMGVPPIACPVVTTPQDFNFKFFLEPGTRQRELHETHTRAWLERADRVLLSSHAVEAELREFYPEHAAKASVVHLGIDLDRRPPPPEDVAAVARTRGLPPDFVLVSGWLAPHKNQLAVVDAIVKLRSRGSSLPIVFVGPNAALLDEKPLPGARRGYVDEVVAALRAADLRSGRDFHALGYVSDLEIQALYRLATMFVVPSTYEGFGLPGLEAMLAGCPVLLSAIRPFEEQNRLLGGIVRTFDPKDPGTLAGAMEGILARREEAAAAARLASERVRQVYDWRKTARAYLAAFDDLLAARTAVRRTGGPPGPIAPPA